MAITEGQPASGHVAHDERPGRRDRVAGWVLTLAWLCLFVVVVGVGDRPTSYGRLEEALRAGDIGEVGLPSTLLSPDAQGYEQVELWWSDGLVTRTATLTRATDGRAARDASRDGAARPVIVGSVADHLTALAPDVRVVGHAERGGSSFEGLGWRGPGWVVLPYLALLGATLVQIGGPRPWRATRWAWAWLVLLAPAFGIPAYLVLGGPTGLFRPRPPGRVWLTGGWAFLLAVLLGGSTAL